ncbi:MAG: hypothetical protein GF400_02885 [Candidatus Eisenbacteria bacterium]|nr:hypothetical protein [Candidatus Eisenbacteria bacterium]
MLASRMVCVLGVASVLVGPALARGSIIDSTDVRGHWTASQSPYVVEVPVVVPKGEELLIDPGVEVLFAAQDCGLTAQGTLTAAGSGGDSILFSSLAPGEHNWAGLALVQGSDASVLDHCIVEYALATSADGGGVRIADSDPLVRDSCIRHCVSMGDGGGLSITNGSSEVRNCRFAHNSSGWRGGGLFVENGVAVKIHACEFFSNSAHNGGGVSVLDGDVVVRNSTFVGNYAYGSGGALEASGCSLCFDNSTCLGNTARLDGGGGVWIQGGSALLQAVTLRANETPYGTGGGVGCQYVEAMEIISCCIVDNHAAAGPAGGVHISESGASVRKTTVCENTATASTGLVATAGSVVDINDSIFGSSAISVAILSEFMSVVSIGYCDVAGGMSQVQSDGGSVEWLSGNLFEDPLFCNPPPLLEDCSPCLGAASDGGDIGCSAAGCVCGNQTSVDEGSCDATWTEIKFLFKAVR